MRRYLPLVATVTLALVTSQSPDVQAALHRIPFLYDLLQIGAVIAAALSKSPSETKS